MSEPNFVTLKYNTTFYKGVLLYKYTVPRIIFKLKHL